VDSFGSGYIPVAALVHGDEPSGPIKCRQFFEYWSNCWLIRKDSPPWSSCTGKIGVARRGARA
jgi:hypothetical protein